ncbi:MAG TPA: 4'-phosphopantetheinyl transferase superfamily protein [Steroidobacteraceae bacterium]
MLARPTQPLIDELLRWLRGCLPAGVAVAARSIADHTCRAGAFAAEERLIAGAVSKRRNEFRTGRELAREALAQVGCAPVAIPARAQRDPIWPRGFIGSIAHSEHWALAIAASSRQVRAVGIDLEQGPRLEERLIPLVCRADETAQAAEFAALGMDHAKLCFVAKEAVFKALFPLRRDMLGFDQVRITFNLSTGGFRTAVRYAAEQNLAAQPGTGWFLCGPAGTAAAFTMPQQT